MQREEVPSWEVRVSLFREILVLPLRLSECLNEEDFQKFINEELLATGSPWMEIHGTGAVSIPPSRSSVPKDLTDHSEDGSKIAAEASDSYTRRHTYAEKVYFHPFVQRFLYDPDRKSSPDDPDQKSPPVRRFVRNSGHVIRDLRVGLDLGVSNPALGEIDLKLAVERCELAVIEKLGVAILTLEVAAADGEGSAAKGAHVDLKRSSGSILPANTLMLADVLAVHDCLRRLYAPFYTRKGPLKTLYPARVRLLGEDGKSISDDTSTSDQAEALSTAYHLTPGDHFAPWWKTILGPAMTSGKFVITLDDRIPSMVLVAAADAGKCLEEDHIRLCFADGPDTKPPYAPEFMKNFRERHAYTRFSHWGTTYFMSSYSFTALCGGVEHARDILQEHFRRHYYRMFFLVQMQKAALLGFSNGMSEAIRKTQGLYSDDMRQVRNRFINFTHSTWFSNVSNQEQARELFHHMQQHAGNPELYDEVKSEIEAAREELEISADEREADNGFILNILVAIVSIVSSVVAIWEPVRDAVDKAAEAAAKVPGAKPEGLLHFIAAHDEVNVALFLALGLSAAMVGWLDHRQRSLEQGSDLKLLGLPFGRSVAIGLAVLAGLSLLFVPGG